MSEATLHACENFANPDHLQCFQLSPSIFLFPYVRKVFDLPKFTDTLVSYLPGSGLGQYQLIDSQATFSIGPNAKAL